MKCVSAAHIIQAEFLHLSLSGLQVDILEFNEVHCQALSTFAVNEGLEV